MKEINKIKIKNSKARKYLQNTHIDITYTT